MSRKISDTFNEGLVLEKYSGMHTELVFYSAPESSSGNQYNEIIYLDNTFHISLSKEFYYSCLKRNDNAKDKLEETLKRYHNPLYTINKYIMFLIRALMVFGLLNFSVLFILGGLSFETQQELYDNLYLLFGISTLFGFAKVFVKTSNNRKYKSVFSYVKEDEFQSCSMKYMRNNNQFYNTKHFLVTKQFVKTIFNILIIATLVFFGEIIIFSGGDSDDLSSSLLDLNEVNIELIEALSPRIITSNYEMTSTININYDDDVEMEYCSNYFCFSNLKIYDQELEIFTDFRVVYGDEFSRISIIEVKDNYALTYLSNSLYDYGYYTIYNLTTNNEEVRISGEAYFDEYLNGGINTFEYNDGILYVPYTVKSYSDSNGNIIETITSIIEINGDVVTQHDELLSYNSIEAIEYLDGFLYASIMNIDSGDIHTFIKFNLEVYEPTLFSVPKQDYHLLTEINGEIYFYESGRGYTYKLVGDELEKYRTLHMYSISPLVQSTFFVGGNNYPNLMVYNEEFEVTLESIFNDEESSYIKPFIKNDKLYIIDTAASELRIYEPGDNVMKSYYYFPEGQYALGEIGISTSQAETIINTFFYIIIGYNTLIITVKLLKKSSLRNSLL